LTYCRIKIYYIILLNEMKCRKTKLFIKVEIINENIYDIIYNKIGSVKNKIKNK
jgi:hypothetical protein